MRGVAMLGALAELQRAGWLHGVRRFAGTSVGAVLATVLAIDADVERVFQRHVQNFRYAASIDVGSLDKTFGLDTGDGLRAWIDVVLREPITFAEVKVKHGSTLLVCASNLNTRRSVVFGPDTHPDMDVARALRMSCSVPLYFAATTYENELYVDGAITDNFPVDVAAREGGRVLGVRIRAQATQPGASWTLERFMGAIVESVTVREVCQKDAVVLELEVGPNTQPLNFRMPPQEIRAMYELGKTQGAQFIVSYAKKHH